MVEALVIRKRDEEPVVVKNTDVVALVVDELIIDTIPFDGCVFSLFHQVEGSLVHVDGIEMTLRFPDLVFERYAVDGWIFGTEPEGAFPTGYVHAKSYRGYRYPIIRLHISYRIVVV